MSKRQLVLVTGAPRSGTTVVGNALRTSWRHREIYEAMNAFVGDKAIRNQFEVPGAGGFSEAALDDLVERIETGRLRLRKSLLKQRNPYLNRTNMSMAGANFVPLVTHLIWKDPFAFFCAPHLARRGMPVIVTQRNHLSLVGSFKRMDWLAPVGDLSKRMVEAGYEIDRGLLAQCQDASTPTETGALMWHLLNLALLRWLEDGEPVNVVRNDDLLFSTDEVSERLHRITGLPVALEKAESETAAPPQEPLPQKAHIANRDAKSITDYWKTLLDEDEVALALDLNGELAQRLDDKLSSTVVPV
ncbi:hypothetical protein KUW15_07685 [Qipengyuania aquimaris]|uniref:hypothetical protein n=1 Tax=Qipengyuania aquimaris TaxID=255984 RepID=UPI001C98B630|nr:hypothetical protein [Qipengyuania aquimaris]MBY6128591.1 hypothetical protein [Qipengyuania aquimaris]